MKAKRMGILLWFTAPLSAFSLQRDVMRVTKMLFYRRIYCGGHALMVVKIAKIAKRTVETSERYA
jgi:hypothetical protein